MSRGPGIMQRYILFRANVDACNEGWSTGPMLKPTVRAAARVIFGAPGATERFAQRKSKPTRQQLKAVRRALIGLVRMGYYEDLVPGTLHPNQRRVVFRRTRKPWPPKPRREWNQTAPEETPANQRRMRKYFDID